MLCSFDYLFFYTLICTFILSVSVFHNVTVRVSQFFSVRRVEAGKREKSIKVYFNESFSFLLLGDIYARGVVAGGEPSVRRIIYKFIAKNLSTG